MNKISKNIKVIVISTIIVFSIHISWCQNTTITGFVRDSLNGEPLIGATIWDSIFQIGTSTDRFGHYSLVLPLSNEYYIEVSYIGYKQIGYNIKPESSKRVDFGLTPGVDLGEIQVKGQKAIEERIEMGVLSIPMSQLKTLPVIGEPDVLKTMQLMPGIQGGSEGRSGLYVRGGSPDQNLMLLDGASVYYVNHFGNFLSLFHPEIISNIKLYKGSFPAKYGGRLSSVVDLRMREGNKTQHKGSFGIGLLSADILVEGPIKKNTTSYIISARRFYLDALLRPYSMLMTEGVSLGYKFYDIYGKVTHSFNENNRLFLSYYSGYDQYGYNIKPWDVDNFKGKTQFGWGNLLATTRLNSKISDLLLADFILAFTQYNHKKFDEFFIDSNYVYSSSISQVRDFSFKNDYNLTLNSWYKIDFGGGLIAHFFKPGTFVNKMMIGDSILHNNKKGSLTQNGIEPYIYLENIIEPTPFLKFNIGLRYSGYLIEGTAFHSYDPSLLAVVGNKTTGAVKISYNKTTQPIHLLSYQNVGTPTDLWMPATTGIPPARGVQFSIGYSRTISNAYEISIEAYQKQITGLIDYKDGASYQSATLDWQEKVEKDGSGTSSGLELLLRKNIGASTGWIGYTLSKTDRYFENKNNGNPYPYIYDRRHDISLVFNHRFNNKFNLSASWVFGTGYPITLDLGSYNALRLSWEHTAPSENYNPYELSNDLWLYSDKNSIRMGNSHRLDIGFLINGKTKRGRDKTWSFNVYNAYNRQNPATYYYTWRDKNDHSKGKSLWQQSGLPIVPSFTYRVKW